MTSTQLIKNIMYKSLGEGVYRDIITKSASYYYYLGETLGWEDENLPPSPVDSPNYEHAIRNEIITIKEIKPSDVAFVVPRRNWASNVIYDMYDDRYSDQMLGVNVISGGDGYINIGDIEILIEGGGGTGASAVVSDVTDGQISGVLLLDPGTGYTSIPTVSVISSSGSGANLAGVIGISSTKKIKLEDCAFYVVTDEYNVYKCLNNNGGVLSSAKPTGTQLAPIETADGYIWKFMYNIPINLRNKFYTDDYIPVVSALTNHFYSNGTIDNIYITSKGKDYTTAIVSVTGDGYREADPIYITQGQVVEKGSRYTNPSISFTPPFPIATAYTENGSVNLGQMIFNSVSQDYYEVASPGTMSNVPPTHRDGIIKNGTSALKYRGTTLKGSITTRNDQEIISGIITNAGFGYTTAPTLTVTDPTGTGSTLTASIGTSTISNTVITNGGTGYTAPVISVTGGSGTGCILQAVLASGVITSVNIINAGIGYVTEPTVYIEDPTGISAEISVVLSGSPITEVSVITSGAGYTNPSVAVTGGGGSGAVITAEVEIGVIDTITLEGAVRDIVILNSGSGYINAPEITFSNGGGQYAVARSKLYADKVVSAHIVDSGQNYTSAPDITFSIPYTQGLEVYTNDQFSNGSNLYTVVENGVFGSKAPGHTTGTEYSSELWVGSTAVVTGETVYYQDVLGDKNLYEVLEDGFTSTTAPEFLSGDGASATYGVALRYLGVVASLRRDGSVAVGYCVLRYGAGYSATPGVTITDNTGLGGEINFLTAKSEAKISAITENGQLIFLVVDDPGIGYTRASLTVSGDGTGAALVADLSLGAISSQQANNEILTPAGTIDAIAIVSGGYSYGVANISIEGDGTGASAQAIIDPLTNAIKKINITNRGQNYTYANVRVIGNGYAAELRAIISPYGGHGKSAPEELYSRSLMLYTNISDDLNQGVSVGNDYRQIGILKDPRVFDGFERFQGTVGSGCFLIQSPVDNTRFAKDDDLYIERIATPETVWVASLNMTQGEFLYYADRIYTVVVSGTGGSSPPTTTTGSETNGFAVLTYAGSTKSKKAYRIVSVANTYALIQSLDNDIPESNDVLIKTDNITDNFTVVSVGYPGFDKFSGHLLYVDNKQGFTPSADETITLRTIIQF